VEFITPRGVSQTSIDEIIFYRLNIFWRIYIHVILHRSLTFAKMETHEETREVTERKIYLRVILGTIISVLWHVVES